MIGPAGVTFHTGRMYVEQASLESDESFVQVLEQIRQSMDVAIRDVLTCEPDYLVMGMSAETFWGGVAGRHGLRGASAGPVRARRQHRGDVHARSTRSGGCQVDCRPHAVPTRRGRASHTVLRGGRVRRAQAERTAMLERNCDRRHLARNADPSAARARRPGYRRDRASRHEPFDGASRGRGRTVAWKASCCGQCGHDLARTSCERLPRHVFAFRKASSRSLSGRDVALVASVYPNGTLTICPRGPDRHESPGREPFIGQRIAFQCAGQARRRR